MYIKTITDMHDIDDIMHKSGNLEVKIENIEVGVYFYNVD